MRRHDTDVTSLVFGLLFVGLAGLWVLVDTEVLAAPDVSVLGPLLLVVAGVIGLVATVSGTARSRRRARTALLAETTQLPVREQPAEPERPADPEPERDAKRDDERDPAP